MIAFDPSSLSPTQVAGLNPGQVFCYRDSSAYKLALRVASTERAAWLNLSGKDAFVLECLRKPHSELLVLPMPIAASNLRIRFDPASGSHDLADSVPGRLVFEGETALIAARWSDLDHRYFNAVACDKWEVENGIEPRFAFERWALSYRDESGHWVDLIQREPSTTP